MMKEKKGIMAGLLDFSFSELITEKIISILYIVGVIIISITGMVKFFKSLHSGGWGGIFGALWIIVIYVICIVAYRVYLELIMVFFKIAKDVRQLASKHEEE